MSELSKKAGLRNKEINFQSFAGTDVSVVAFLPVLVDYPKTPSLALAEDQLKQIASYRKTYKQFAEIQTLSISSTRSVSPVRVLGRSSALAYTRGARTFAGTMVFASINHDVFKEIYTKDIMESNMYHSTSLVSDQLPPFNIVMSAANEKGGGATQVVYGVTLVNYGTTYSIDDLYTEVTYSYVAQDISPLMDTTVSLTRQQQVDDINNRALSNYMTTISDIRN